MIDLIFYSFAFFTVLSGLMVITLKNPVHAVLFLIFAFFNAAGLFILIGAEFIAMTLIIVYVGAVAVLFLFVVMMLNIDITEVRQGFLKYLPLGLGLGFLIFIQITYALQLSKEALPELVAPSKNQYLTNTEALGHIIYTKYFLIFQGAGIVLLIAMVGAIVLTLTHSTNVRRQSIHQQVSRTREQSVMLVDVKSGEGVNI
jgi:NADH-quinone oxidoreductase subunit J